MSEPPYAEVSVEPPASRKGSFLWRRLPYIAVLLLTLFGVAYTSMAQQPLAGFWEALAVLVGVLCVTTAWSTIPDRAGRVQLIWKQAAHWAAILFAMNIVLLSGVQKMLTSPATGLALLPPQPELKYLYGQSGYLFPRADAVVIGGTFEEGVNRETPAKTVCQGLVNHIASNFGKAPVKPLPNIHIHHPDNAPMVNPAIPEV